MTENQPEDNGNVENPAEVKPEVQRAPQAAPGSDVEASSDEALEKLHQE